MYKIIKMDGTEIGLTEKANYIRKHTNGCYILCDKAYAQGVAYNGTPYSIGGLPELERVILSEMDGGTLITNAEQINAITFVTLAEAGSIDEVTAGEHVDLFAEWAYPIAYKTGNLRKYHGMLYKCISDHTSQETWNPEDATSLWAKTSDPNEEWPAWSQPVGAADAYALGDKVSHNDKKWTSNVDANVWEPGVYGWNEYTE